MGRRNDAQRIAHAKLIGKAGRLGDVIRRHPERLEQLRDDWPELVEVAEELATEVDWPWPPA